MEILDLVNKYVFDNLRVKIKGDVGEYQVFGIDMMNMKLYIGRTCRLEWVGFGKIKKIWEVG